MKTATALMMSLCALLAFTTEGFAQSNSRVDTKDVTFTFPPGFGEVKQLTKTLPTADGTVVEDIWAATDAKGVTLILTTGTSTNPLSNAHGGLVHAREHVLNEFHGEETTSRFFTLEGRPALEFEFSLTVDQHNVSARERAVCDLPHKLYSVMLIAPPNSNKDTPEINQSFDSLKIK